MPQEGAHRPRLSRLQKIMLFTLIVNGYAEVTMYQFSSGSWLQLASFTNTGTNPEASIYNTRNFTINYSQMYASPSNTATIEPLPPTLKKMVFAFYYQWYFNPTVLEERLGIRIIRTNTNRFWVTS